MRSCLYLVSSSASREYVSGCVEALALPRGTVLHFRYLHPYIDERLRDCLPSETGQMPPRLRGLPVVVVYLYQVQSSGRWQAGETMNPEGPYLPLRCGRLIHAFSDGVVAHFYFEVGDYVKVRDRGPSARALLKKIRFRTNQTKHARPSFAHIGRDLELGAARARDALSFQRFVYKSYEPSEWRTRSLGSTPLDVTYDIVFARVAGFFQERNDRLTELLPVQKALRGNIFAEYVLESGRTYHIKVITHLSAWTPAELPGRGTAKLVLRFNPAFISAAGSTEFHILSQYDLHYWSFVANCTTSHRSVLTIGCDHEDAVDRDNFVRRELLFPEIDLPISIVVSARAKGIGS